MVSPRPVPPYFRVMLPSACVKAEKRSAWYSGVTQAAPDRLITRSKISITFTLPISQKEKIERIPGVEAVTYATWFGGYYKDPKDYFPQIAYEGARSFALYPEFIIDSAVLKTFDTERNAAIVGVSTMERLGWKVGDAVQLTGMKIGRAHV